MKKLLLFCILPLLAIACRQPTRTHVKCDNGFDDYVEYAFVTEDGVSITTKDKTEVTFSVGTKCVITRTKVKM